MKQGRHLIAAWAVATGFTLLATGCASNGSGRASTDSGRAIVLPLQPAAPPDHVALAPLLPPAGPGADALFKDDGAGVPAQPRPDPVPDAIFTAEAVATSGNRPYRALGQTYVPVRGDGPYSQQGVASWYGHKFHGRRTASGERYDMYKMTAAHPTLPIPSYVCITNLDTGRHVIVRINDRGPFLAGRMIDVSYMAALKLGMLKAGRQQVQIDRIRASDSERVATLRREADADASAAPEEIRALMLEDRMVEAEPR